MKNFLLKSEYLNTLSDGYEKLVLSDIFEKNDRLEEKYNKDLATFSVAEIDKLFNNYTASSLSQIEMWCNLMAKYSEWFLIKKNIPTSLNKYRTYIKKYEDKTAKKMLNFEVVISEEELEGYCSKLDSIYDKLLLRAAYEGIDTSQGYRNYYELTADHINVKNNTIDLPTGRTIKVSDVLISLAMLCAQSNYYFKNETGVKARTEDSNRCFKLFSTNNEDQEKYMQSRISNRLVRIKQYYGWNKITLVSLRVSGFLTSIEKMGLLDNIMDYKTLRREETVKVLRQYNMDNMALRSIRRCITGYLI